MGIPLLKLVLRFICGPGTANGEFRIVTDVAGAGSAVAIAAASPTVSNEATATLDCEDLSEADGLQSSAWDGFNIEFRKTSGTGFVYIATAAVYEKAA